MTSEGKKGQPSIGNAAWKEISKNFGTIAAVAAVTVALRVASFLPMLLCVDFGGKLPTWTGLIVALALYIAVVIPMRFWGREKMRRLFYTRHVNHRHEDAYRKWLKTGLLRYLRGILWGVPFLAGTVYFTVYYHKLDAKTFWMPVRSLAVLAGQEPNLGTGLLIALILMTVFGLLFAYGWWRDLPVEYLPVRSMETDRILHWSRRIRKKYGRAILKNTLVNFLISLPFWIGVALVLVPYVRASVVFSMSTDLVVSQSLRLLRSPLPAGTLLILGGVALVLYVPFWILRKTRNAALIGMLMEESEHSSRPSIQMSEENVPTPATAKKMDLIAGMGSGEKEETPLPDQDDTLEETPPVQTSENDDSAQDAVQLAQDDTRLAQESAKKKQE